LRDKLQRTRADKEILEKTLQERELSHQEELSKIRVEVSLLFFLPIIVETDTGLIL
jgi:hypothetical protein